MRIIFYILLATAPGSIVWATPYEGKITQIKDATVYFKESNLKVTFALNFKDDEVKDTLAQLKKDDFISFEGIKNLTTNVMRVDSVNYVGLSDLLGVWTGDENYCYDFQSFTEVAIYPKTCDCKKNKLSSRFFAYTVNIAKPSWFVLMSDATSRLAADLKLNSKTSAEMVLYDVNTGNTLRLIKLSK
jgi:hypothetical protein